MCELIKPKQKVILYTGQRVGLTDGQKIDQARRSTDKWRAKGKKKWTCPECGRTFPSGKTKKQQPHKMPSPNQWMMCSGRQRD